MRGILLSCLLAAGLAFVAPQPELGVAPASTTVAVAQEPTPPDLNVDVDMDESRGAWYQSPLWLAIGGLAVLVLVLIIVFAGRGSGTTVIKD